MRSATILVLLALVCGSQAQINSLLGSTRDVIGNLINIFTDSVTQVTKNLQDTSTKGIDDLNALTRNLQSVAEKPIEGLNGVVDNIVKTTENQVDQLIKEVGGNGVDLSECKELVAPLRDTATNLLKESLTCSSDTVKKATDLTQNIVTLSTISIKKIVEVKDQLDKCTKGSEGIMAIFGSSCIGSIGLSSVQFFMSTVPNLVKDITGASKTITDLETSLNDCVSTKVIEVLNKQTSAVVNDVKNCIAKITGVARSQTDQQADAEKSQSGKGGLGNLLSSWFGKR